MFARNVSKLNAIGYPLLSLPETFFLLTRLSIEVFFLFAIVKTEKSF
nr:MAG TPA: hypothetical protein [Caudoviricetes sp.]